MIERGFLFGPLRGDQPDSRDPRFPAVAGPVRGLLFGVEPHDPVTLAGVSIMMVPVLAVIATMFYWLWRIRIRHSLRGVSILRSTDALPARPIEAR